MIRLGWTKQALTVMAVDDAGVETLSRPLHQLFIRAQMKANPQDGDAAWKIAWGHDKGEQLEKLTAHLRKYNLEYELDDKCLEIVEALQSSRREFASKLKEGLSARKTLPGVSKRRLEKSLSPQFIRRLNDHQLHALHHLCAIENGANFSVPGSGKTSIVLAYYHLLRLSGSVDGLLVIGPASCFEPWEREYELCFGKQPKSIRIAGNTRSTRREIYLAHNKYELLLTTYHTTARDVRDVTKLLSRRKYLLVLDESHYVKRPEGGKLASAVLSLADYAERRVILTGTPMPNGLSDLWSQITFLRSDMLPLGSVRSFLTDVERRKKSEALQTVRRRILPLFFRITKSQLGLPRPQFRLIKRELSKLQARIYRGIAARFLSQVPEHPKDRDALRDWRRARAVRLLQVAVNPALLRQACDEFSLPPMDLSGITLISAIEHYAKYEIPGKIETCCKLATRLASKGKKIVIWSTFVHNLRMLNRLLSELNPVVIHGQVPYSGTYNDELTREQLIQRFKNEPLCQALIANPAACAESISLHMVCHDAIYVDRSFNCAHYLQSLDRIHRLGLRAGEKTTYYLLESVGTIDEVVHHRLREKMRNMREVIEGSLPGQIPGFWTEDLGEEEDLDYELVQEHLKSVVSTE